MEKVRDIYKEAVREIEKQLKRGDVTGAECALHISNVISDVKCYESGRGDVMVYLKKETNHVD
jgi:hypothetical protein